MPTQVSIKSRSPPPYREPLPGSTFALTLLRPTVITVGPKVVKEECHLASNEVVTLTKSPVVTTGLVGSASKRSENTSSAAAAAASRTPTSVAAVSPNGLAANRVKAQQQPQNVSNNINNNNNNNTTTNGNSNKNDRVSGE